MKFDMPIESMKVGDCNTASTPIVYGRPGLFQTTGLNRDAETLKGRALGAAMAELRKVDDTDLKNHEVYVSTHTVFRNYDSILVAVVNLKRTR